MKTFKLSPSVLRGATVENDSPFHMGCDTVWDDDMQPAQMQRIHAEAKRKLLGKAIVEAGQCDERDYTLYKLVTRVTWHTKYGKQLCYDYETYMVKHDCIKKVNTRTGHLSPNSEIKLITADELRGIVQRAFNNMVSRLKKEEK